jgi:hypothetical protein
LASVEVVTEVPETVCVNAVALVDTLTTATVYCVAPVEAFQPNVGVCVVTVGPGGDEPPGDNPVGVGGTAALVVKLRMDPLLVPALFCACKR